MDSSFWKNFLSSQGAHWDAVGVSHFGTQAYPTISADNRYLVNLSHWKGLTVKGKDAKTFLQGQVTCDLNALSPGQLLRGAHCNVKGRAVFSFYLADLSTEQEKQNSNTYLLLMPASTIELAQKTLAKFIVFSKADVKPLEDSQIFGLINKYNDTSFADNFSDNSSNNKLNALKMDSHRHICIVSDKEAVAQWNSLAKHFQLSGYPTWTLVGIELGIGDVELQTSEQFIPQFLNFHLTNGISFTKGCYIGQEVVARMEYRGTLKKHMRRARVELTSLPDLGTPLYSTTTEQSVGDVVSAVNIDSDSIEILAVVNDQAFEHNDIYTDQQKTHKLQFLPLPYAITK